MAAIWTNHTNGPTVDDMNPNDWPLIPTGQRTGNERAKDTSVQMRPHLHCATKSYSRMDYKELQEEFVRDHNGTSMTEVFMTLSILPVSVYLP